MDSICGANCSSCALNSKCDGCMKTDGKPFGGSCIEAEYIKLGSKEYFDEFKSKLISEINSLKVEGLPKLDNLNLLAGFYVNLEYPLPSGETAKLLDDKKIYLGNQVASTFNVSNEEERCFGIVADLDFILICEYGENGANPEIVLFKRR